MLPHFNQGTQLFNPNRSFLNTLTQNGKTVWILNKKLIMQLEEISIDYQIVQELKLVLSLCLLMENQI